MSSVYCILNEVCWCSPLHLPTRLGHSCLMPPNPVRTISGQPAKTSVSMNGLLQSIDMSPLQFFSRLAIFSSQVVLDLSRTSVLKEMERWTTAGSSALSASNSSSQSASSSLGMEKLESPGAGVRVVSNHTRRICGSCGCKCHC